MKNYSQALSDLLNRNVEKIKPLRVILFDSVARNSIGKDSDIDLLGNDNVPPSLYGFDFAQPTLAERSRSLWYFN